VDTDALYLVNIAPGGTASSQAAGFRDVRGPEDFPFGLAGWRVGFYLADADGEGRDLRVPARIGEPLPDSSVHPADGARGVGPDGVELLGRWARGEGGQLAVRAGIVLLAAEGLRDVEIARRLGVSRRTVGIWRQRYSSAGIEGLRDRPHPGRPSVADEADIIVLTLLAPAGRRSSRALALECGFSHSLVATVRHRWNLTQDRAAAPVLPVRPALPDGEVWVLGFYHDARRMVMLLGSSPHRAAATATATSTAPTEHPEFPTSVLDPSTIGAVEAALLAIDDDDNAAESDDSAVPGTTDFEAFLTAARRRHARFRLHAIVLQGEVNGVAEVSCHQIPARTTWRSFARAVVGIDCVRHVESSKRVYLDLAAELDRFSTQDGADGRPVRWLREALPVRSGSPTQRSVAGGTAVGRSALGTPDESVVIEAVRLDGPMGLAELSERTLLTRHSVARTVRSLVARELLVEDAQRRVGGGQPRTVVRLRGDAAHALGIHIDPEVLTAVLVDLSGTIVAGRSEPIVADARPVALLDQVVGLGERVLAAAGRPVEHESFLGIGVAAPGPLDTASGTVLDPPLMSAWRDVPLLPLLEKAFNCPITIEKDSTAALLGERWIGRASRARDFVYLYLGTGVGAGLFLNGEVYRGLTANAGEFGQLCAVALGRVGEDGRPKLLPECNPVASVPALASRSTPVPPGYAVPGTQSAAYRTVCEAAASGRADGGSAVAAIRRVAGAIGRGALGVVSLLDIGLVVVGGPFCTDAVAGLYLAEIERVVNGMPTAGRGSRQVVVERSVDSQRAAAVGAASAVFQAAYAPRPHGSA
jgi:predicted NBD/HSP70 family sugar kinase/transposase